MTNHTHLPDEALYTVHHPKEISQILADLAKNKTMINVSFNHGHDQCLTTIIAVDREKHVVYLDIGCDEAFNSRLLASHHVVFSKDGGIMIKWTSANLSAVTLKDGKAIKIALPKDLIRVQRREFFRIATPIANPVICIIPYRDPANPDVDEVLVLTLVDASLGGIGVMVPDPLHPALVERASFEGCKISFPGVGETNLTLCIRSTEQITMRDGSIKHRLGLEYVAPSRGNQGLIQRYIFNLERELMAIANSK